MRSRKPPVNASEFKRAKMVFWLSILGWIVAVAIIVLFRSWNLGAEAFFLATIPLGFGMLSLALSAATLGFGITFIRNRSNGRDFGWMLTIVGGLPVAAFLVWIWLGMLSLR